MVSTEELIRQLAADVTRQRGGALRRIALALGIGWLVSLALLLAWLGPPVSAVQHAGVAAFTTKLLFALLMATMSTLLLVASGRPGETIKSKLLWLLLPPLFVGGMALLEMSTGSRSGSHAEMEPFWQTCLAIMVGLSVPVFAGLLWAFRRLAPTRLRLAGFLAGVSAGSTAAVAYALYCPGTTATFLASWYLLGMAAPGLVGWVLGPRLLRW